MHAHTCTHMHTCTHTHVHTYTHAHTHIHAHTYTHIHTHKHTHTRTHKHTYTRIIASLILSGYSVLNVIPCPHFRDGNTGAYIGQQVNSCKLKGSVQW